MAVESVERIWPGRDGSDDIRKRTTFNEVWEVWTDTITDDATVAGGTSLLPRLADPHPNYPDAFVVGVDPRQREESPFLWHVTIRYSSEMPTQASPSGSAYPLGPGPESQGLDSSGNPTTAGAPAERPLNPIKRPVVIRRTSVEVEEPFITDANDQPVLASNYLPYDPPAMTKFKDRLVVLIKNVAGISNQQMDAYIDGVNDAPWKGIAAGKARVVDMSAASNMENNVVYTEVTVTIQIRKKGWKRKLIDRGRYEYIDSFNSFEWRPIKTPQGTMPAEPSLLNGAGHKLQAGAPAVVNEHDEFGEVSFDDLMDMLGIP